MTEFLDLPKASVVAPKHGSPRLLMLLAVKYPKLDRVKGYLTCLIYSARLLMTIVYLNFFLQHLMRSFINILSISFHFIFKQAMLRANYVSDWTNNLKLRGPYNRGGSLNPNKRTIALTNINFKLFEHLQIPICY